MQVLHVFWDGCEEFYSVLWAMGGEEDCVYPTERSVVGDKSIRAKAAMTAEAGALLNPAGAGEDSEAAKVQTPLKFSKLSTCIVPFQHPQI